MLAAVVPTARIWTFHYNANYHTNAPVVDILGVGKVLLQVLQARREEVSWPWQQCIAERLTGYRKIRPRGL
jgi:hypothetical protein